MNVEEKGDTEIPVRIPKKWLDEDGNPIIKEEIKPIKPGDYERNTPKRKYLRRPATTRVIAQRNANNSQY